jgi:hypothetical protein
LSAIDGIDELKKKITTLNTQVMIAAENGLFARQGYISLDEILDSIRLARAQLERAEYIDCVTSISHAEGRYFTALNSTSRRWCYSNVYAVLFIGTLFFVIGFIFSSVSWFQDVSNKHSSKVHVFVHRSAFHT